MSDKEDFDDQGMEVDPSQEDADDDVSEEVGDDEEDDGDSDDSDIDAEVKLYENYAEILNQISAQSYGYDNYVKLVQMAHELNDLDKIRESCELFSAQFPLSPEIWTKWLQIELTIATSEGELKRLNGLLKRALADYFAVTVGGLHSQLAPKMVSAQEIWDMVLETYGLDCMEGSTFFKDWRSYYTKAVPESPEKFKKLLEVFTYELSLPLAGIQETYAEFNEFVEKHNEEVDWEKINESYHKAKDNLYTMLKFEEELVSLDDKEHHKRAAVYTDYIEKSKTFLNYRMVQILYERMVTACCLNSSSWIKYVKYLKKRESSADENEKSPVFKQTSLDIINRALRNCTWSAELYLEKIRLSEKEGKPKVEVTEIAQQAFEATVNDSKGHLNVWLEYLSYIKRNTNLSDEKDVEILRKNMELGHDTLTERSADANNEFDQLCARIEYGPLKNSDLGYQHYDKAMKNYNNSNKAILWIEFAHLDLNRGADAARKIFRRAIKVKNIDDFETIMSSWKSLEYAYGTSDQIRDCHEMCEKIIENYNKTMAIKNVKTQAQKRKNDSDGDSKISEKKQKKTEENPFKVEKKKPQVEKKKAEFKTKTPTQPQPEPSEREFGEKDDVSIFLSNLAFDAKKEDIIAAFPELKIKDVTLIAAPGGRSKGYGYAELSNPSEVDIAVKFDRRPINGRPVFITKVLRDKNVRPAFKYSESKESNKIFVKGLPFDTTKEEIQILFGTFGQIKDIRLPTRKDGKFKGIGFIDYDTDKAASKAVLTMDAYVVRGMTLAVAISDPPPKPNGPQPLNVKPNTFPGFRGQVPRGEAKPRLSFIPTSVQRNVTKPPAASVPAASNGSDGDKTTTSKSNDYFRQLLNKK